jgi:hypothetical protein
LLKFVSLRSNQLSTLKFTTTNTSHTRPASQQHLSITNNTSLRPQHKQSQTLPTTLQPRATPNPSIIRRTIQTQLTLASTTNPKTAPQHSNTTTTTKNPKECSNPP